MPHMNFLPRMPEALREHQARLGVEIAVTPELGQLLDESLENLDQFGFKAIAR